MSIPTYWYEHDRDEAAVTQWPFITLVIAIMIAILVALVV